MRWLQSFWRRSHTGRSIVHLSRHDRKYLLYADGDMASLDSPAGLFTFGLTLLTCLIEFAGAFATWCWRCDGCNCCCNWLLGCCAPATPPFDRRSRFITGNRQNGNQSISAIIMAIICWCCPKTLTVDIFAILRYVGWKYFRKCFCLVWVIFCRCRSSHQYPWFSHWFWFWFFFYLNWLKQKCSYVMRNK